MMESLDKWDIRVVKYCILCLFLIVESALAKEGFVSILCCAKSNFTDLRTNITWRTDDYWYSDKENCRDIIKAVQKDTEPKKARIFKSGSKWCYKLNTKKGQDYLIRGTFLTTSQEKTLPDLSFQVLVGTTRIGVVNSPRISEIEGILKATDDYTNFCLLKQKGDPYLSKLEMRPLDSFYLNTEASEVLQVVKRVDVGSRKTEIRYPEDPYDRIWKSTSTDNHSAIFILSSHAKDLINRTDTMLPPIQVLQTAVAQEDRLEFRHDDLNHTYSKYFINLYFLELDDSVRVGDRVFNIYINNEKKAEIDIVAGGSRYSKYVLSFTANGCLNLTMMKAEKKSRLGPICNAYEILQVHAIDGQTNQEEANAVTDMQTKLLESNQDNEIIKSWSGDPCLPTPWHGLHCETRNGTHVIKLDLSSSNLTGPLPPSVTNLTHLEILNISDNHFSDSIPTFPETSLLTTIDLRDNNLIGEIPESIASLPHLKALYFGCNPNLSTVLPPSFNKQKLTTDNGRCGGQGSSHHLRIIVIGTVAGASFLASIAAGVLLTFFCKRRMILNGKVDVKVKQMAKNAVYSIPSVDDIVLKAISIQNFTLEYIENATLSYKTSIGEGGFGSVYRGTLPDGQEIAVKVRSATSTQGTREFNNELSLLSAIRHDNLVPLLGYCSENDQQILVYPFMSNGSLQDRLYGEATKRKPLDWPIRLSIALGAARGLTYLHTFPGRSIIHRDVKSSNILLDHSMCAKVADFGFSKYAPQEGDSGASLEVRGTAGYLDPEYYTNQHLSAKSDVFSFGVVLLEIISGREPLNIHRPRKEWSLVEWAKANVTNARIDEIVDPSIKGGYHAEAMWRVVEVSLACVEPFSAQRPCMEDIVRELEDALIIENNASEYMRSIDSFGGSNRFSIERTTVIPSTATQLQQSSILSQPAPPQPR